MDIDFWWVVLGSNQWPLLCERRNTGHRSPPESTGFIDDIGKSSRVVQLRSCLSRFILVSYSRLCSVLAGGHVSYFFHTGGRGQNEHEHRPSRRTGATQSPTRSVLEASLPRPLRGLSPADHLNPRQLACALLRRRELSP